MYFQRFINFLNEFILSHPLIRFSQKLPMIKYVDQNYIKLIIYDLIFFLMHQLLKVYLVQNYFG